MPEPADCTTADVGSSTLAGAANLAAPHVPRTEGIHETGGQCQSVFFEENRIMENSIDKGISKQDIFFVLQNSIDDRTQGLLITNSINDKKRCSQLVPMGILILNNQPVQNHRAKVLDIAQVDNLKWWLWLRESKSPMCSLRAKRLNHGTQECPTSSRKTSSGLS